MPVVGALLPHRRHGRRAGLEVAEVLLAQTRLFIDFDGGARKRRGSAVSSGGGEGGEDAFGGFAGAAVRGGEEVKGVGGTEEGTEFAARFFSLKTGRGGKYFLFICKAMG